MVESVITPLAHHHKCDNTAGAVLHAMREHSGSQAPAPICEQSQHPALHHDGEHRLALVAMREAERDSLQDEAGGAAVTIISHRLRGFDLRNLLDILRIS